MLAKPGVETALTELASKITVLEGGWIVGEVRAGQNSPVGVGELADAIYTAWYARPASVEKVATDPPLHRLSLTSGLRAAHPRSKGFSPGWIVLACDATGAVRAMSGQRMRWLRPGEYVLESRPGVPPAPGEQISVIDRLDHVDPERRLWWTYSPDEPVPPIGRIYANVRAATAAHAIDIFIRTLMSAGVSYQAKIPELAEAIRRVDSLVIYHSRRDRPAVLDALGGAQEQLSRLLDDESPPLTCSIAPGLSWADDPGDGKSFGQSRCSALATAVAGEPVWNSQTVYERLGVLCSGLMQAGIDPEQPWLA